MRSLVSTNLDKISKTKQGLTVVEESIKSPFLCKFFDGSSSLIHILELGIQLHANTKREAVSVNKALAWNGEEFKRRCRIARKRWRRCYHFARYGNDLGCGCHV